MGHYTHLSVVFACDGYAGIAELAKEHADKHADEWKQSDSGLPALSMLNALAEHRGVNIGHKGGLFTWGLVGNYAAGEKFVRLLTPFFLDVFRRALSDDDFEGPLDFEHVLVFFEPEQSEHAQAYELSYDEDTNTIAVKHHDKLPFAWMQY